MVKWTYKIDVAHLHKKYDEGEITIQEISKNLYEQLKPIQNEILQKKDPAEYSTLNQLSDIIDAFQCLSLDKDADTCDYDVVLQDLYDWGDTWLDDVPNGKKLCWINTI